jgi:MFS transporter, ACS family, DAL5 transporter family protein
MGITCALLAVVGLQAANIFLLNKMQSAKRVKAGKPAKIRDLSMEHKYTSAANDSDNVEGGGVMLGENAFKDLTDSKNDEFVYVY